MCLCKCRVETDRAAIELHRVHQIALIAAGAIELASCKPYICGPPVLSQTIDEVIAATEILELDLVQQTNQEPGCHDCAVAVHSIIPTFVRRIGQLSEV